MLALIKKKVPGPQYDVAAYLTRQIPHTGPAQNPTVARLKKTRMYIKARLSGAPHAEAKKLSALPVTLSSTAIVNSIPGQQVIAELAKHPEFQDTGVAGRLKEMWHHKRTRFQKVGDDVERIYEDDTDMWKFSMDRVLELRGLIKQKHEEKDSALPTIAGGITFNVLQVLPEEKNVSHSPA